MASTTRDTAAARSGPDGATAEELDRLRVRWGNFSPDHDAWAAMRSGETAVVVFEPRPAAATSA